jgi:hypothetical protein
MKGEEGEGEGTLVATDVVASAGAELTSIRSERRSSWRKSGVGGAALLLRLEESLLATCKSRLDCVSE